MQGPHAGRHQLDVNSASSSTRQLPNMSGAGSTTNVALRPWPAPTKEALSGDDLFNKVFQLTQERGHLRGTTEKSLQDEIDAGKHATGEVMEGVEQNQKKDAPTKEDRLEEIGRQRREMFTQIE